MGHLQNASFPLELFPPNPQVHYLGQFFAESGHFNSALESIGFKKHVFVKTSLHCEFEKFKSVEQSHMPTSMIVKVPHHFTSGIELPHPCLQRDMVEQFETNPFLKVPPPLAEESFLTHLRDCPGHEVVGLTFLITVAEVCLKGMH